MYIDSVWAVWSPSQAVGKEKSIQPLCPYYNNPVMRKIKQGGWVK
jgi:hypothetical protein